MKRYVAFCALLGACGYGPLYRGPIAPNDARIRRLGSVSGTGTGYNAGIAAGRAHEEAQETAHACGADQVVDVYEEGDCVEPARWLLFFLPTCSVSVRGIAVSYRPDSDSAQFEHCVQRHNEGN